MSTTTSVDPFANSCSQLDKLIKRLESDLGVQEPFDVKKAMSAQAAPAAVAPAAPQKAAATIGASGAAAAAAASGGAPAQDAAAKPKKEKVDKPAAAPKAPPAAAIPDIEKIDMRVGLIVSAEKHPDADSLYLEKIDVGEAEPRQVLSGLAGKIPLESMTGRRVVAICNLKPAKMRGLFSYAMIFAASSEDDKVVELVTPPEGAKVGERVTVEGFAQPPLEAQLSSKVWDNCVPKFRTNASREACFDGHRFMTSAGPCLPPPAPSHHYPSDGHENPITHPHPHPHKVTPSARLGTQPQGFESQVKVMPLPTESVNKEHTSFENAMLMRQQRWPHHKAHRRICRQQKRVQS